MANQKTWMKTMLNGLIVAAIVVACVALLLALRAFADANMGLKLSKDPRMLASTTGILGALLLGGLGLLAMLVVAFAIVHHTETIRAIANRAALDQAAGIQVTDLNWRRMVEQVTADALHQRVNVLSFADMDASSAAWIRFVISGHGDGRVIVFATSRRVMGCKGWGQAIDDGRFPHAAGELRAVWNYFANQSGQPSSLPRDCTWFVLPLQTSLDRQRHGIRAQLVSTLRKPVFAWLRATVDK